mmetsp:Transcript_83628/g.269530  ORF Transcript_83628/g.269530 Transcript_83628/m.269530 type:complete len:217 (-) Transcript_83628:26-676(-)
MPCPTMSARDHDVRDGCEPLPRRRGISEPCRRARDIEYTHQRDCCYGAENQKEQHVHPIAHKYDKRHEVGVLGQQGQQQQLGSQRCRARTQHREWTKHACHAQDWQQDREHEEQAAAHGQHPADGKHGRGNPSTTQTAFALCHGEEGANRVHRHDRCTPLRLHKERIWRLRRRHCDLRLRRELELNSRLPEVRWSKAPPRQHGQKRSCHQPRCTVH